MKTLTKIATAELMSRNGYELGDFKLEFVGYEDNRSDSVKSKNSVFANFKVFDSNGNFEIMHSFLMFDYGFVTPKGYKSSKKVPVTVKESENITMQEVLDLKQFKSDYKINTFDPFYAENEAARRNASAWNYIAANFITDPYCTR